MAIRIGICGTGHLGKIHLKCLRETDFKVVGFYDPDVKIREQIIEDFGIKAFQTLNELLREVDALDVVSPTPTHFEIASAALSQGKHVFVEKPVCSNLSEALALQELCVGTELKVQVGHVERFNPVFSAIPPNKIHPRFVESHRLAQFNPRGTDVSVVLDLMIHDIDLLLALVKSEVSDVRANGVSILSHAEDICNARIEFEDGCVANLTASRISIKQMRKFRVFQDNAYISLDFLDKKAQWMRFVDEIDELHSNQRLELDTAKGKKYIEINEPEIIDSNAIALELNSFYSAISKNEPTIVGLSDGIKAMRLAQQILDQVHLNQKI
jgi:predicted dehydrogenase